MPGELVERHRRPGRQPVQLPRAELHHRRRLRLGARRDRRPRSRGSQTHEYDAVITGGIDRNMGVDGVREVLQDRRAVGHRHAAVRRRRRRLRDGRGRRRLRAEAAGRRRARRRPRSTPCCSASAAPATARARASPRRTRSASGWPSSGLADAGRRPGHGVGYRGARHVDPGRATPSSSRASPSVFGAAGAARARSRSARSSRTSATSRPRPGPPGCSRRCMQLHDKVLAAQPALRRPEPQRRLGRTSPFRVNTELRDWPRRPGRRAPGRRQRVRLRRHQLPRGAGGVRARPAPVRGRAALVRVGRGAVAPPCRPHGRRCDRRQRPQGAAARRARARRRRTTPTSSRSCERVAADAAAGHGTAPAAPDPGRSPRRRPRRHRLRRRRRPRRQGRARPSRRSRAGSPAMWRMLRAQGVFLRHGARRRRSRSSTPARARSTSTCCSDLRDARAGRRRDVRRGRPGHDAAARPAAHRRTSSSTRRPGRGRRGWSSSCARPRSPSPRCSPPTSRSPGCSPPTASRPTW